MRILAMDSSRFSTRQQERELAGKVEKLRVAYEQALNRYMRAFAELEALRQLNSGFVPAWGFKLARSRMSAEQLIEEIIEQAEDGRATRKQILEGLHKAGSTIQTDSLSARLNKMKRAGKIKKTGGRQWAVAD